MEKVVAIWGCTETGEQIFHAVKHLTQIVPNFFIDNNPALWNTEFCGVKVVPWSREAAEILDDGFLILAVVSPENSRSIQKQIAESAFSFRGEVYDLQRYHCELGKDMQRRYQSQAAVSYGYSVDFEKYIHLWVENLLSEVTFWKQQVAGKGGRFHDSYQQRLEPKEFYCERLGEIDKKSVILDVGCGICSRYGNRYKGEILQLSGVDPLAFFYNRINREAAERLGFDFHLPEVQFGMFELLSSWFGTDYCDYILIDNALDHCIDPYQSVVECLKVLKVGGTLSMRHNIDEAHNETYGGIHKWNICSDVSGHFVLWNKEQYMDVTERLREYADIHTQLIAGNPEYSPYGIIVCTISKKKNPPDDIENNMSRMKLVLRELMDQLSNVDYAREYSTLMTS